ncbi:hypothetical protein SEA_SUCHA_60 [Microbacterium phage Sucha]|nr:hypothetical protein SEA_SUCHA_60 [Microbacterium phage Sucha]
MNPRQRVEALKVGDRPSDGLGVPLRWNRQGEWVNEAGDTPCPRCGEMVTKWCWQCKWVRGSGNPGVRVLPPIDLMDVRFDFTQTELFLRGVRLERELVFYSLCVKYGFVPRARYEVAYDGPF